MKFYNRELEILLLQKQHTSAFEEHSKLTVLTGRRRIGKTLLLQKALSDDRYVYLFVSRTSEPLLCQRFCTEVANSLGVFVPPISSFSLLFRYLMELGKQISFTLVIDEFQELEGINPAIFSDIQNLWDQSRLDTHINFVVSGSAYSMMQRIFTDRREPLFGRADCTIHLQPFSTDVLKRILHDYHPTYTPDDLLALYTFTGGVPKYVELLMDAHAYTVKTMVETICQPDSPFIGEGRSMLIQEFGKKYSIYFAILQGMASGFNTQSKLESLLGVANLGGHLKKLEEVYSLITRQRPIMAKPASKTVRYNICDSFLQFWFRYINHNQTLIEIGNYAHLVDIILADYPTYSGLTLEKYFRQKMAESMEYKMIGSWWETKSGGNEIDIVAVKSTSPVAVAIEVKRQKKNFKPDLLTEKVVSLKAKALPKYNILPLCWSLDDM